MAQLTAATSVKYMDLQKARLPYGEEVTITGALTDVKIAVKNAAGATQQTALGDVLTVTGLTLTYADDPKTTSNGTVKDGNWSVVTKKFAQGSTPQLLFDFTGTIKPSAVSDAINALLRDAEFKSQLEVFRNVGTNPDAMAQLTAGRNFAKAIGPLVTKDYSPSVKMQVSDPSTTLISSLGSISTSLKDVLGNSAVPGVTVGMSASEAASKIGDFFNTAGIKPDVNAIQDKIANAPTPAERTAFRKQLVAAVFLESYKRLTDSVGGALAVEIAGTQADAAVSDSATIKDFEKYAGIDYGAIYVPRAQAFRHFFTVNVYFGSVEDQPAPSAASSGDSKKFGNFLQQRISLTFGVSIGDLSSQKASIIKDNNAFVYGMGFRINKYFRLTAGAVGFRDARSDRFSHALMVGPSVDLTAFKFIAGIFGKAGGN